MKDLFVSLIDRIIFLIKGYPALEYAGGDLSLYIRMKPNRGIVWRTISLSDFENVVGRFINVDIDRAGRTIGIEIIDFTHLGERLLYDEQRNKDAITPLLIDELRHRDAIGTVEYGDRLRVTSKGDPLQHLLEELLDAAQYTRWLIERRKIDDGKDEHSR